jgi:uncharacterized protein
VNLERGRPTQAVQRRLPYVAFAVIVIVYLVIIQVGGVLATNAAGVNRDHGFVTVHNVVISLWIPTGAALVFTYAVIAVLGWQRPVLRDDRPVQRWIWVVPIVFAAAIVLGTDYGRLADKGLGFTLILLVRWPLSRCSVRSTCARSLPRPQTSA